MSDERDTSNSVRLCTLWPQLPPNRRKKWRRNWKPYNQSTGAIEWFSSPTLPISTSISNLAPPILLHNRSFPTYSLLLASFLSLSFKFWIEFCLVAGKVWENLMKETKEHFFCILCFLKVSKLPNSDLRFNLFDCVVC